MKAIVICHHPDNRAFLEDLLASIKTKYPVFVCADGVQRPKDSFELGAIEFAKEKFSQFVLLQDTVLIKDNSLFEKLFEIKGHVFLTLGGYHYMGKMVSKDIDHVPRISSKGEAIRYELSWLKGPKGSFKPDLPVHTNVFENRHGQRRMRLENDYIIKWKGTYSL